MTHVRTAARSHTHRDQLSNASAAHFVREDEDPCKMTYSRMALIERDLSATTQMQMHSQMGFSCSNRRAAQQRQDSGAAHTRHGGARLARACVTETPQAESRATGGARLLAQTTAAQLENVDHHDTLDWANLLLEDGGDGRRVDSSGDGDGSSGADGACGCCGDAEAGWRLLMAVTGLTGAARRSRGRLTAPLRFGHSTTAPLRFGHSTPSFWSRLILSCSIIKHAWANLPPADGRKARRVPILGARR